MGPLRSTAESAQLRRSTAMVTRIRTGDGTLQRHGSGFPQIAWPAKRPGSSSATAYSLSAADRRSVLFRLIAACWASYPAACYSPPSIKKATKKSSTSSGSTRTSPPAQNCTEIAEIVVWMSFIVFGAKNGNLQQTYNNRTTIDA